MAAHDNDIRGIKQGEKLHLLQFPLAPKPLSRLRSLLEDAGREELNLPFLTFYQSRGHARICLAVAGRDRIHLETLISAYGLSASPVARAAQVVSLFPHKSRTSLISRSADCLIAAGALPFMLLTSLSTINLVLDDRCCAAAVEALLGKFSLPASHSPVAAPMMDRALLETIAVYREIPVRTYGFETFGELHAVSWKGSPNRLQRWMKAIEKGGADNSFRLVLWQDSNDGTLSTLFLVDARVSPKLHAAFNAETEALPGEGLEIEKPFGMIHFQGPHYAERPGIAAALSACLDQARIHPLAMVCCAQSIFIVVPEKDLARTQSALAGTFEIPT